MKSKKGKRNEKKRKSNYRKKVIKRFLNLFDFFFKLWYLKRKFFLFFSLNINTVTYDSKQDKVSGTDMLEDNSSESDLTVSIPYFFILIASFTLATLQVTH